MTAEELIYQLESKIWLALEILCKENQGPSPAKKQLGLLLGELFALKRKLEATHEA